MMEKKQKRDIRKIHRILEDDKNMNNDYVISIINVLFFIFLQLNEMT